MVNWEALEKKELKAPFIPIIKSEVDVSNFDTVKIYLFSY